MRTKFPGKFPQVSFHCTVSAGFFPGKLPRVSFYFTFIFVKRFSISPIAKPQISLTIDDKIVQRPLGSFTCFASGIQMDEDLMAMPAAEMAR